MKTKIKSIPRKPAPKPDRVEGIIASLTQTATMLGEIAKTTPEVRKEYLQIVKQITWYAKLALDQDLPKPERKIKEADEVDYDEDVPF